MNILILNWRDSSHPKSGGAEIVTMEHAKGWVKAGNSVTWLTSGYREAQPEEKVNGVKIIRRAGSLTIYLYAPIYLILNGNKFDIIVDEIHGIPFFTPLWTRTTAVVFIHEIAGEIWDYMYSFPVNYIGKLLEYIYFIIYRNNWFWTDASSTIEELVNRGISKNRCIAIPCPLPGTAEKFINKKIPFINSGVWDSEKNPNPTYIFISRLVKMKGIEEVIKAFSFIHRVQPDAELWLIGGGDPEYLTVLRSMVTDYKISEKVTFWQKVDENKKYKLFAKAHILLHASVKEGWGLVVLEAASQGIPAVVYNVPGLKDVVINGVTGIILDENSPQKLAEAAVSLYQNRKLYKMMQAEAYKRALSFNWKEVTATSLKFLQQVSTRDR